MKEKRKMRNKFEERKRKCFLNDHVFAFFQKTPNFLDDFWNFSSSNRIMSENSTKLFTFKQASTCHETVLTECDNQTKQNSLTNFSFCQLMTWRRQQNLQTFPKEQIKTIQNSYATKIGFVFCGLWSSLNSFNSLFSKMNVNFEFEVKQSRDWAAVCVVLEPSCNIEALHNTTRIITQR